MLTKEENKILIVDDEPLLLKNIGKLLDYAGYLVDPVDSGEKAFNKLEKNKYDLILTDLMMEKINGMDVLIEAKKKHPETAVIIMTGYADVKIAIEAIKNGADDFMFKPAESDEIYFRIRRCLENIDLKKKIVQRNNELEILNCQLKKDILERKRTEKKLKKSNKDLSESLAKLKIAQNKLIQSEKLASLGGLISGVMHEINSPIGIGITASSYILQQIKKLKAICDDNENDRRDLKKILDRTLEGASMVHSNLSRAGDLIANFKQVSVDQVSEQPRKVIVDQYIDRKSTRLNSSHRLTSRMPSSA
jgi:DNA-binding response OmpR family regulator